MQRNKEPALWVTEHHPGPVEDYDSGLGEEEQTQTKAVIMEGN